jgi:antitoxin VapB
MSLNIKNDQAHRLARELAKVTGESMTVAVSEAIRERLERVRENSSEDLAERILKIGRDCAAHLKKSRKSIAVDDLYDEKGMFK